MQSSKSSFFFFNDTATTEIYTLSLHDALPISSLMDVVEADARVHADPFQRPLVLREEAQLGGQQPVIDVRRREIVREDRGAVREPFLVVDHACVRTVVSVPVVIAPDLHGMAPRDVGHRAPDAPFILVPGLISPGAAV